MATAKIENGIPHIYTAVAEILKSLSVAKGGTLPGNMGGKPYITAVDASAETKRQFVENNLVFFPNERVIKHEIVTFKDRLNIAVVVEGTYKIVSTIDGSSEVVSGSGDGLATGTAVASNIASTNALKNALLRTFLITEQSVEDAAKNGAPEPSPAQQKVNQARAPQGANRQVNPEYQQKIRREFLETGKETQDSLIKKFEDTKAKNPGKNKAELYEILYGELTK